MNAVEADFYAKMHFPGNLQVNTAGNLLYSTKKANIDKNFYDIHYWICKNSRIQRLRLSSSVTSCWWRESDTLLLATRGGSAQKRLAAKGLPITVFQARGLPQNAKSEILFILHNEAEWAWPLPGGGVLVLAQWDPSVEQALTGANGDPEEAATLLEKQRSHTVLTEMPFCENGGGMRSGKRRRLYLWKGGEPAPLTGTDWAVEEATLTPDGKTVYIIAKTYRDGVADVDNRLYKLDLATKQLQDLTFGNLRLDVCLPLADGRLLVAGSDMKAHGLNQNPAFYRLDTDGTPTLLDDSGQYGIYPSVGSDVNQAGPARWWAGEASAYFAATVGDSSHLLRLDAETGAITQVSRQPGAISEVVPAEDGWFAVAQRGLAPPEVYHLATDGTETQITHLNNISDSKLAAMEPLSAHVEGCNIHGWVMLPPGQKQDGAKIPGLLYIHGGPKTVYGPVLFHEMQYWAAQGYVVMLCNPHGSDGRGDDFADIRGDYGGRDSRELLAFLDTALAHYSIIDPARLGVAGGSYGGFMVNWLIGHTNRFAAAVSQRSISSWQSMALLSDIGYYFVPDQAGAGNWQAACGEAQRSPLTYAQNVRTPTLFLHSDEDYRCPLPEGIQMYAALKLCGVPTRMVVFHGENHELSRSGLPQNRLHRLAEMRAWLARYLKP